MSDTEFLVDENVLGLARYLDTFDIKYRKVGDENCPPLKSDDPTVVGDQTVVGSADYTNGYNVLYLPLGHSVWSFN